MFVLWIIIVTSVTIECQECIPCPDGCTCTWHDGLDCSGLELTSVLPGCGDEATEEVDFSNNNITVIEWRKVPNLDGGFCEIYFQNNAIHTSTGTISLERCSFFDLNVSHNDLTILSTDFFVSYGDVSFVDIILTHNSITEIMPGAIKMYNSSSVRFDVDLSFNKLSYIHPGAFDLDVSTFDLILQNNNIVSFSILSAWQSVTEAPSSLDLDLSSNLIEYIQVENENEFDDIYRRIDVNLDNNTWNCDCNHKGIAFRNSVLRDLIQGSSYRQFLCNTPNVLRNVPVLSLAPDDFVCPPSIDPHIDFANIEISPGETVVLVCPVTFADPPITHYEWNFSPLLSVAERKLFGGEMWKILSTRRTSSNNIEVENVQREGVYECQAVSPGGTLSVSISVSFTKSQQTVPSFQQSTDQQTSCTLSSNEDRANCAYPCYSVQVLFAVLCIVTLFLTFVTVIMALLSFKFFKFLRSEKASGRKIDRDTTKGESSKKVVVEDKLRGRYNVSADNAEYCVPSKGIYNKTICLNEA